MNWLNIPDEIGSFAECCLLSYVIQCLNKHYNHDNFEHVPTTLTTLITS